MFYFIEEAKYGYTWEFCEWVEQNKFDKLEDAIQTARDLDGDGKIHFRVIDETKKVLFTHALGYETGVFVNHLDDECKWAEDILQNYSLPKELLLKGVLKWLERNTQVKTK